MKVLVTGATGFVGKKLVRELTREGHTVNVLSRNPDTVGEKIAAPVTAFAWHPEKERPPAAALDGVQAIFHLAGEGVADKRWTEKQKKKIYDSRVLGTRHLVEAVHAMTGPKPTALISASAIGFYGDRGSENLTESSSVGTGFLAEVCRDWEKEEQLASVSGLRVVSLRIGIVLGREGGMLKKVLPIFKTGLAGPLGNGQQSMSWIHVEDLVSLFLHAWKHENIQGIVNAVSPSPLTNGEFTKDLGRALNRPAFLPAPAFGLKLVLGELSGLLLGSQKVLPERAAQSGFVYRFPRLTSALADLVKKKAGSPSKKSELSNGSLSP